MTRTKRAARHPHVWPLSTIIGLLSLFLAVACGAAWAGAAFPAGEPPSGQGDLAITLHIADQNGHAESAVLYLKQLFQDPGENAYTATTDAGLALEFYNGEWESQPAARCAEGTQHCPYLKVTPSIANDPPPGEYTLQIASANLQSEEPATLQEVRITIAGRSRSGRAATHTVLTQPRADRLPGAVQRLTARSVGRADRLTLYWLPPQQTGGPATETLLYQIRYSASPESPEWITLNSGTANKHTLLGLEPGTSYQLQVRVINAAGAGPWSATLQALAGEEPELPDSERPKAPGRPVVCPPRGYGLVTFYWNAPPQTAEEEQETLTYQIRWGPGRPGERNWNIHETGSERQFTQHIEPGLPQSAQVRASNQRGWSDWSEAAFLSGRPTVIRPGETTGCEGKPEPGKGKSRGGATNWRDEPLQGPPDRRHRD